MSKMSFFCFAGLLFGGKEVHRSTDVLRETRRTQSEREWEREREKEGKRASQRARTRRAARTRQLSKSIPWNIHNGTLTYCILKCLHVVWWCVFFLAICNASTMFTNRQVGALIEAVPVRQLHGWHLSSHRERNGSSCSGVFPELARTLLQLWTWAASGAKNSGLVLAPCVSCSCSLKNRPKRCERSINWLWKQGGRCTVGSTYWTVSP